MKCCFKKQNISKRDKSVRLFIAFFLIVFSFLSNIFTPLILSFILLLTVFKGSCLVYRLLKINENLSLEAEFKEIVLKYNSESTFVLNKNLEIIYKNEEAKESFSTYETFTFIKNINLSTFIEKNEPFKIKYNVNNKDYIFSFIVNDDFIIVYSFDISILN